MSATTASANASTSAKSVLNESRQIERAAMLIEMGAACRCWNRKPACRMSV